MTEYHIGSRSRRFYADDFGGSGSGGSCLDSARFQENPTGDPLFPQDVLNAGVLTMRWSHQVFDDLGFAVTWDRGGSGEFLFPTSGDYLIVCYIQIEPNAAFTAGNVSVVFEPNFFDPLDAWWEQVSNPMTDPGTKLSLSAVHRIDLNENPGAGFWVDVHSWNVTGDGTVTRATISITRLCEGVPSDEGGNPH